MRVSRSTLVLLAIVALATTVDAKRRRGSKGKARRAKKVEVAVDAEGEIGNFGGFAAPPVQEDKRASPPSGGKDMRAEFAKYKDCQACTGAGWGWCPIRRMCGGFANKNCRGDETDFRAGSEPAGTKKASGGGSSGGGKDMRTEFAKYKDCQACTGAGWGWCPIRRMCGGFANKNCRGDETDFREGEAKKTKFGVDEIKDDARAQSIIALIDAGDDAAARAMVDADPSVAKVRTEEGHGPLFAAYAKGNRKLAKFLKQHGANPHARNADGQRPKQLDPRRIAKKAKQAKQAKQAKDKRASPPSGGKDMRAEFAKYKDCQACTGAGWGWCPIRRMCGGFANKNCRGDETDFKAE